MTSETATARGLPVTLGRWLLATGAASLAVLVLVLDVGGGGPQKPSSGLPDPGALTGWGLPIVRLGADLAGFATVGLALSAALLLPAADGALRGAALRGLRMVAWTAGAWALLVAAEIVFTISDFLAQPIDQITSVNIVRSFVVQTTQGRALLVQCLLAAVLAAAARWTLSTHGATWLMVGALAALTPPGLTGHSAASGSHDLAVFSILVHVLAASLWVGGLFGLAWAAYAEAGGLGHAVPRFSRLALWCFAVVGASGVINAAIRLGTLDALVSTAYGRLVLAKAFALGLLAAFGVLHRRRTVDALARTASRGTIPRTGRAAAAPARAFLTLAAFELVIMACTVGLAVGLSRTPTPIDRSAYGNATTQLLGFPLPPAPTAGRILLGWLPDGFGLTFVAFATSLYLTGLLVLRRKGVAWPVGRTLAWFAGVLVVAWATCGGLGLYAHVLFSAHMAAHMLLSMVAPILLVLGAPVTLALRTLPGPRVRGESSPRELLVSALHSRAVRVLTHPLVALALFVGSPYAIYFSSAFPTLMTDHLGHVVMELTFLTIGSLFFFVLVGVDPAPRPVPPPLRVGLLFGAMAIHAFFSLALMSSSSVLGASYFTLMHRPYATDLLADQHLGGGIGWAMGELPMLLVVGAIFVQWVRADEREARRMDRAADRAESHAGPPAVPTRPRP